MAWERFFDELYLPTTEAHLSADLSHREAVVIEALLDAQPEGRYLDLGCGHGRHVAAMGGLGYRVTGIDRSPPALALGAARYPDAELIEADYRALPFEDASFDGAYAWYSGLFLFDAETHLALLREVGRVLKPGARLVHEGANPFRLRRNPEATHQATLPDGATVEEHCVYDLEAQRERGWRRLTPPGGEAIEARWEVWHPRAEDLETLLEEAGFKVHTVRDEQGLGFDPGMAHSMVTVARWGASSPEGETT